MRYTSNLGKSLYTSDNFGIFATENLKITNRKMTQKEKWQVQYAHKVSYTL